MTISKTLRHSREMRKLGQVSITQLLQRDGIMYFLVTAVLSSIVTVMQILSFLLGGDLSPSTSTFSSIITPYYHVFPNLLINRLVLNLRTFQRPRYGRKTTTPKLLDDLAFATNPVLGNIGAPLDPDQWDEEYIEDNEDLESEVLGEVTDQQLGEEEVQDVALESLAARDFSTSEGLVDEERRMTAVQGTGLSMVTEDAV
ncbi:uncharacterized protein STEHIDRAFT_161867 [Stereum hirsutum FP-91666 SS1]|uniref:uncharacterized protein n=1 Tax=Stereum hirsutum (strain FP-91666) TaxID=721885 RepID=UPI000444997A|nr:uncharacterized protein STEHIDRAFT_161867 [Stereum hirsutum FP-91666 SS1]EIM81700.1 hypothetical protein STEHIDRAFT_161867 [Stereum hirsutum FP-91666 SS1]